MEATLYEPICVPVDSAARFVISVSELDEVETFCRDNPTCATVDAAGISTAEIIEAVVRDAANVDAATEMADTSADVDVAIATGGSAAMDVVATIAGIAVTAGKFVDKVELDGKPTVDVTLVAVVDEDMADGAVAVDKEVADNDVPVDNDVLVDSDVPNENDVLVERELEFASDVLTDSEVPVARDVLVESEFDEVFDGTVVTMGIVDSVDVAEVVTVLAGATVVADTPEFADNSVPTGTVLTYSTEISEVQSSRYPSGRYPSRRSPAPRSPSSLNGSPRRP